MSKEEAVNVNLPLRGELLKKATDLKNNYGLESYTELIRVLLTQKHKEIFGTKSL